MGLPWFQYANNKQKTNNIELPSLQANGQWTSEIQLSIEHQDFITDDYSAVMVLGIEGCTLGTRSFGSGTMT